MRPLGLYIHIPFCRSICRYCNFCRFLHDDRLRVRYVAALETETMSAGASEQATTSRESRIPADTIYFGGGTPSLLEPGEVRRLVLACRKAFEVPADAEVTLEMNPESASEARLCGYLEAGVNRLSIGIQSFRDEELQRLGRLHTVSRAKQAYKLARAAGFDNISFDLMMWLPGQTVLQWMTSVERMIELGPDHASLYMLELHRHAPLCEEMAREGWSLAPDDEAADMYVWAFERLDEAGYKQYEISNVARDGRRSRHNLKYWTDGEWLGFGCGAHSTRAGVRWSNVTAAEDYTTRIESGAETAVEQRVLSPKLGLEEALFTGLRLTEGVDVGAIASCYGFDPWTSYGLLLAPYVESGLLVKDGSRLRLTRQGMLLANEVMSVFV